ncbi:MAG: twin-arginine translocase TatA/TatE family subunit [Acidobacteria bacterium]|nr:twin-arginine translocase TatA/TatE family subunit [Acidobacteriota bacterium]
MFEGIFQPTHLLVILVVALLVFGPKKLPEFGKGLGEAISGFKKAIHEGQRSAKTPADTATKKLTQKTGS